MSKHVIFHNCTGCRSLYPFGKETTLFLFIKQPIINHLVTRCPVCQISQTFWDLDDQLVDRLVSISDIEEAVTLRPRTYAADRTWQKFCAATGRRYPGRPRFTSQEAKAVESQVGFLRHLLDTGRLP